MSAIWCVDGFGRFVLFVVKFSIRYESLNLFKHVKQVHVGNAHYSSKIVQKRSTVIVKAFEHLLNVSGSYLHQL